MAPSHSEKKTDGSWVVVTEKVDVRLAPTVEGLVTNSLQEGTRVSVYETRDGWARISKYYDASVEKEGWGGQVARWIPLDATANHGKSETQQSLHDLLSSKVSERQTTAQSRTAGEQRKEDAE